MILPAFPHTSKGKHLHKAGNGVSRLPPGEVLTFARGRPGSHGSKTKQSHVLDKMLWWREKGTTGMAFLTVPPLWFDPLKLPPEPRRKEFHGSAQRQLIYLWPACHEDACQGLNALPSPFSSTLQVFFWEVSSKRPNSFHLTCLPASACSPVLPNPLMAKAFYSTSSPTFYHNLSFKIPLLEATMLLLSGTLPTAPLAKLNGIFTALPPELPYSPQQRCQPSSFLPFISV